jgi:ATP-binding cassette subfamily C protein
MVVVMILNPINKSLNFLGKHHKKTFWGVVIANIFSSFLEMISLALIPILISVMLKLEDYENFLPNFDIIEKLLAKNHSEKFILLSIFIILFFIFKNAFIFLVFYFEQRFLRSIKIFNIDRLYNIYISLPLIEHYKYNSALLQKNILQETTTSANYIFCVMTIIRELILFLFIFILLFLYNSLMILSITLFLALSSTIYLSFIKKRIKTYTNIGVELREYQIKNIHQVFSSLKETKIYNTTSLFLNKFIKKSFNLESVFILLNLFVKAPRPLIEIVIVSSILIFVSYLIQIDYSLEKLIPMLGLLVLACLRLIPSFNSLTSSFTRLKEYEVSLNIVTGEITKFKNFIIDRKQKENIKIPINNFSDNIKLDKIYFNFPDSEKPVIANWNLEIKKGERVGIIGKSGSGKTTLINIILGLIKPVDGQVLVDKKDIHLNLKPWHSNLGFIPQEIYLLDDTILNNIFFGSSTSDGNLEKVKIALKSAEIYDFVMSLPEGLETKVGERGVKLSGGQRQRIGIARALYRNPKILILDEATSSLDGTTEKNFINNIFDLSKEKTIIISTHKLDTLKRCNKIFEIVDGKLNLKNSIN